MKSMHWLRKPRNFREDCSVIRKRTWLQRIMKIKCQIQMMNWVTLWTTNKKKIASSRTKRCYLTNWWRKWTISLMFALTNKNLTLINLAFRQLWSKWSRSGRSKMILKWTILSLKTLRAKLSRFCIRLLLKSKRLKKSQIKKSWSSFLTSLKLRLMNSSIWFTTLRNKSKTRTRSRRSQVACSNYLIMWWRRSLPRSHRKKSKFKLPT